MANTRRHLLCMYVICYACTSSHTQSHCTFTPLHTYTTTHPPLTHTHTQSHPPYTPTHTHNHTHPIIPHTPYTQSHPPTPSHTPHTHNHSYPHSYPSHTHTEGVETGCHGDVSSSVEDVLTLSRTGLIRNPRHFRAALNL